MSEEETDTRSWFLRIASGVVFGPVPTKALRLWAEQGRVQPGNEISLDRKNWIPAPSLEELDIVWYLEDNQGNLTGPFNKRAAEKLISDGRVGEGTSIVHKDDADLAHLVRPAIENRRKKVSGGAPELDFGADEDAASADENALRTECEGLRLRVEVLEKSQKQLLAAAEKECKSHERQLQAERNRVSKLEAELEETRLAAATARNAATQTTETDAKEIDAKLAAAEAKCAEVEAALAEQAAKHKDELAVAKAMCAEMTAKLEALQSEYAELLAFSNERDTQAETRIAELSRRPQISISDEADRVFAAEIEYLNSLFDEGQKRQKQVRERIDELVALRSGGLADAAERQARMRAEKAAIDRNREEINNLRLENARNAKHAEAREQELQRRIRLLEIELSQTKESAREADDLRQRVQNLTDAVNDRDQILVRERQERAVEHQQLEQAQQALLQRLESLEKAAVEHREAPKLETAAESEPEAPPPPPPPRPRKPLFHATPWMSFKK
jgi:hypothetical protein